MCSNFICSSIQSNLLMEEIACTKEERKTRINNAYLMPVRRPAPLSLPEERVHVSETEVEVVLAEVDEGLLHHGQPSHHGLGVVEV